MCVYAFHSTPQMAQRLAQIPEEDWNTMLPEADKIVAKVNETLNNTKWEEEKQYKKTDIKYCYGVVPGSTFKAIKGHVRVQGDIRKALAYDLSFSEITPDMPKAARDGRACKYIYFHDKDTEEYCKKLANEVLDFKPVVFLMHQVNQAGVPMVSDREFVTLRVARELADKKGFEVVSGDVSPKQDFGVKKVVRAQIQNRCWYEVVNDHEFDVNIFFFCDPCGKIPASLFTATLEHQMEFLVNVEEMMKK